MYMRLWDNMKFTERRGELCFKIAVFIFRYVVDRYAHFK